MNNDFAKLHLSVILAGFTGVFGKLITMNSGLIVWYRLLFSYIIFSLLLHAVKKFPKVLAPDVFKIIAIGMLLGLHWFLFYSSIKASNVSVGVVCYSLVGFFTAFLEPLINKRPISVCEVCYSLISVAGIILIFNFDTNFRTGIILGCLSSLVAAMYNIVQKNVGAYHSSKAMLLYELLGGFIFISMIMPFYFKFTEVGSLIPFGYNFIYLVILASFCTIGLYILQIQVLKTISAFTVGLTDNLEPVYSVLIAMLFLGEAKQMSVTFYFGLCFIILSVVLQSIRVFRLRKFKTVMQEFEV